MTNLITAFVASIPSPPTGSIHIGPIQLRAYGLLMALGVIAGIWLMGKLMEYHGVGTADQAASVGIWGAVGGVIGARLYHVATDWDRFADNLSAIPKIWEGGLGIPGGLLLGTLFGVWRARRLKLNVAKLFTFAAPSIALGQSIARWGNYFNQELFGKPTTLPWGLEIDAAHRPSVYPPGTLFQPTFLYESLWNLALVGLLLLIHFRVRLAPGRLFGVYLVGYGAGRFWIEGLRIDPAHVIGGLRWNQWVALAAIVAGAIYLIATHGQRWPAEDWRPQLADGARTDSELTDTGRDDSDRSDHVDSDDDEHIGTDQFEWEPLAAAQDRDAKRDDDGDDGDDDRDDDGPNDHDDDDHDDDGDFRRDTTGGSRKPDDVDTAKAADDIDDIDEPDTADAADVTDDTDDTGAADDTGHDSDQPDIDQPEIDAVDGAEGSGTDDVTDVDAANSAAHLDHVTDSKKADSATTDSTKADSTKADSTKADSATADSTKAESTQADSTDAGGKDDDVDRGRSRSRDLDDIRADSSNDSPDDVSEDASDDSPDDSRADNSDDSIGDSSAAAGRVDVRVKRRRWRLGRGG